MCIKLKVYVLCSIRRVEKKHDQHLSFKDNGVLSFDF